MKNLLKRYKALCALLALHARHASNPDASAYCAYYREEAAKVEQEIISAANPLATLSNASTIALARELATRLDCQMAKDLNELANAMENFEKFLQQRNYKP